MNEALQSHTPTERPLEYDSLSAREGCEVISGNDFLGWRAYEQICVFAHDAANPKFTQPDTVSYSVGPTDPGVNSRPWQTNWAVWVASLGVRTAKAASIILPANSTGATSGLLPEDKPSKVAHAFSNDGLLAIATQKTLTQIQIKRYTSTNAGTGGDVATNTFTGVSPVMFNSGNLDSSIETKSGLVCLYLRPERPTVLFGRFERDTTPFGVERVAMPDLRVSPARLIGVEAVGRRQLLRYIDTDGRDVTLTSPIYTVEASGLNKLAFNTSLEGGRAYDAGVGSDSGSDKAKITMAMAGGYVYDATQFPDAPNNPLPFDQIAVAISLEGGEIEKPTE